MLERDMGIVLDDEPPPGGPSPRANRPGPSVGGIPMHAGLRSCSHHGVFEEASGGSSLPAGAMGMGSGDADLLGFGADGGGDWMALAAAEAAADGYADGDQYALGGMQAGLGGMQAGYTDGEAAAGLAALEGMEARVAELESELAATRAQAAAAQATARTQVADVETMLREVTATMQAEIVRSSDAQRAHDEAAAAAALQLGDADRAISQLERRRARVPDVG